MLDQSTCEDVILFKEFVIVIFVFWYCIDKTSNQEYNQSIDLTD